MIEKDGEDFSGPVGNPESYALILIPNSGFVPVNYESGLILLLNK